MLYSNNILPLLNLRKFMVVFHLCFERNLLHLQRTMVTLFVERDFIGSVITALSIVIMTIFLCHMSLITSIWKLLMAVVYRQATNNGHLWALIHWRRFVDSSSNYQRRFVKTLMTICKLSTQTPYDRLFGLSEC